MREKVYFRNPDEFDFRMNNTSMQAGKHVMNDSSDDEQVAKMRKTKDINLVTSRLQHERKKANRLHKELHFIDYNDESQQGYDKLVETLDTIETLDKTRKKIKLDKELMGKGKKKEVGEGVFKWF